MPADKINGPFKIILSSGPRGGKSVISKKIAEWFSDEYLVFVIPETARELFENMRYCREKKGGTLV